MFKITNEVVRTVRIVTPYSAVTRNGKNGQFVSRSVTVACASDKAKGADGADFFLLQFRQGLADAFNNYCSAIKADGKLASRRLQISGELTTYESTKHVNEAGYPVTNTVVNVTDMKFLDKNPVAQATQAVAAAPQMVQQAVAPVAQAIAAPIAQAMPQQMMAAPMVAPAGVPFN